MAIEEELSLNVSAAIDAIGQMAQNLQDALTGFFVAFDDALKQLSASSIPLNFQAEMEGGEQPAFDSSQNVSIEADSADASGAASDIQEDFNEIDPSFKVDVSGDASDLQSSISDATQIDENPDLNINVGVDTDEARSEANSLKNEIETPASIPLEIENLDRIEQAKDDIASAGDASDGLSNSLDNASSSADSASESIAKAKEETKKADDEAKKFELTLGNLAIISAQVFASAVAASAGFIAGFASSAIESESVLRGFKEQLGDLGNLLLGNEFNGLNINLQQLAQNLGSSDEALLTVVQRIALLGKSAGQTDQDIADVVSNLTGVAASIRVTNPAMGELDEIMNRLSTGLARGGNALARLGVNLTTTEIKAEAVRMTGKGMSDEFDRFELLAAGASLAAKKFGDSLQINVADAAESPKIAMERLREVFGDTIEQFGKPLVIPLVQISNQLLPSILDLIEVFADFSAAFVPVLKQLSESFEPIAAVTVETGDNIVDEFVPALEAAAEAIGVLIEAGTPFFNIFLSINEIILSGFAKTLEIVSDAIVNLDSNILNTIVTLYAAQVAFGNLARASKIFDAVLAASLWTKLALAIVAVVGAYQALQDQPDPFEKVADEATAAIVIIEDIPVVIKSLTESLEEYVRVNEILENQDLVSNLRDVGITIAQFAEWTASGEEGLKNLIRALVADGQEALFFTDDFGNRIQVTSDNIDSLSLSQLKLVSTSRNFSDALLNGRNAAEGVINSFGELESRAEATRRAIFNQAVATAGLTPELADLIEKNNTATDGTVNYTKALQELNARVEQRLAFEKSIADVTGETANANKVFAEGVSEIAALLAAGKVSVEDFSDAIGIAGLEVDQTKQIVEALTEEMQGFVDNAITFVPTVAEAFKDLGPENTAQSLIDSFNTQINETNRWNAEMTRLRREGQIDILKVVAELGPQQGLLLLDTYRNNETILADHLRNMAAAEQAALQATREVAVLNWLATREITGDAAEAVVKELEDKLTLADATETNILAAVEKVKETQPQLESAFGEVGAGAADALTVGSAEELATKGEELNTAVEAVWSGAGGVAETASRIAAETGVAKFNEIISTGFLNESVAFAILSRTAGLFSASGLGVGSAFGEGVRLGYLLNQESIIGTIGISVDNIYFRSFSRAIEAGRNLGAAVVNGIRFEFLFANDEGILAESFDGVLNGFAEQVKFSAFSVGGGIGSSLIAGLLNALRLGSSSVSEAARKIISDAETAAKDEAESESPSRVWERLGRDLVSGLTNGLRNSSFLASNAAAGVINQANPATTAAGGNNISISVPVTISGNVDPALGTEIGGRAAAEISRVLRLEAMVS